MNINIQIDGIEEMRQTLTQFGADGDKILNKILSSTATKYKTYIKNSFLSGQYLNTRTGATKASMAAFKSRREKNTYLVGQILDRTITQNGEKVQLSVAGLANIYEHAGGADIRPAHSKVIRFIGRDGEVVYAHSAHLPEKAFMTDSSERFDWDQNFEKSSETVLIKEIAKRFGADNVV